MSGNDTGHEGDAERATPTDGELSARLRRLEARIDDKRPPAPPVRSVRSEPRGGSSSLGQAMTLSTEFVAGVVVGGGLGWAFDRALGTKPWGLIVLLMLGFVAGIYNVMRVSGFSGPRSGRDDRPGS